MGEKPPAVGVSRLRTSLSLGALLALSVAAVALGALLILTPLSSQQIAAVTGSGIAIAGLVSLLPGAERLAPRSLGGALGLVLGVAVLAAGLLIALWPDAGAPWLAFLIGAALIAHGVQQLVRLFRPSGSDQRVTGVIAALASMVFGVVALSWPVLTLTLFRLGIGAWLIFVGLAALFTAVRGDRSAHVPPTALRTGARRLGRWARTIGATLALVLAVGAASGSAWLLGGVPLPQPDKFYVPPAQVPAQPGELIRAEPLTQGVPHGAVAWRILYTTTDHTGEPAVSSGTILAPAQRGTDPLPLLSIAHGTTGIDPKCAPSLSATPFADGAAAAAEQLVVDHGWVAVTSDYIGLGTAGPHPYLVGDAEARNVLDAARAARHFAELSVSDNTVVWGHSQGGQGSLWTGQLAATYAPDLTVLGIGAFAPAADLFGLAEEVKNEPAGKTVSAYIADTWNTLFPELGLESQLTPGSARGVAEISQHCFNGRDVLAAILHSTQVPNQIFPDSALEGAFGKKLREQEPVGPFPAPVLVAQGLADPLVQPQQQEAWVAARCAAGEVIDFREYPGLDHLSLVAADSPLTPELVQWTLDRWAGEAAPAGCTRQ